MILIQKFWSDFFSLANIFDGIKIVKIQLHVDVQVQVRFLNLSIVNYNAGPGAFIRINMVFICSRENILKYDECVLYQHWSGN